LNKISGKSDNLLKLSNLVLGNVYTLSAMLLKVVFKTTADGVPMLKFYFRTADKKSVLGFMFNVDSNNNLIKTLFDINREVVSVTFTVREWGGRYSLYVSQVVKNNEIDPSMFFDSYEGINELYDKFNSKIGLLLNDKEWKLDPCSITQSYISVGRGKIGGVLTVLDNTLSIVEKYVNDPDFHTLIFAFSKFANIYIEYTSDLSKFPYITIPVKLDIVNRFRSTKNSRITDVTCDMISSILGLSTPQHLWSHIVYDCTKLFERQLEWYEDLGSCVATSVIELGVHGQLVKY